MPNNPLTNQELYEYGILRVLDPPEYASPSAYFPAGYFLVPPHDVNGPVLWRKFHAGYIQEGIIDPERLGTGYVGDGNLYLADDGTWKAVPIPATPNLQQVTDVGSTTTNAITVNSLTINNGTYNASIGFGLINNPTGNFFDVFFANNTGLRFGSPSFDGSAFQAFGGLHSSFAGQMYFDYGSQQRTIANRSANFRNASSTSPVTVMKLTDTSNVLIGTTTDSGYKLDVNGNTRISGTIEAIGGDSSEWNQAYSWGDHSTAGYITGTTGFTGVFTIPTNPPGQQNLDIQNGLIMNVF